ncbi:Beta-lactamase-like protein [Rhypophila sp. PSN 637]
MAVDELVHLPEVERLSPAVIRILAGNPNKFTLQGTNTYLAGTGPERLLVDTGQGIQSWKINLAKTLAEEKATISSAIITHWHGDHVGGISDLLELCPSTKIYKNQLYNHPSNNDDDAVPTPSQLDITDNQTFSVQGATLRAIHSPGHTVDHMALVLEEEDAMFTGDNVLGHGTAVFEDLATYLDSLAKMARVFKGRAYPGHGPVLDDGPAKIAEYIRHRQKREDQVVQTLKGQHPGARESAATGTTSSWTVMELVKVIYQDVPEPLHLPASGGVLQILKKLQREGKAVRVDDGNDEEKWRLVVTARSVL